MLLKPKFELWHTLATIFAWVICSSLLYIPYFEIGIWGWGIFLLIISGWFFLSRQIGIQFRLLCGGNRMPRKLYVLLASVLIGVLGFIFLMALFSQSAPIFHGIKTRNRLIAEINRASEIKVIEHSSRWDDPVHANESFEEKVFSTTVLTAAQIDGLRSALPPTVDTSHQVESACIFDPHHRIECIRENGIIFPIEICFQCGEISINNQGQRILPKGWEMTLSRFFSLIGLDSERDFKKER